MAVSAAVGKSISGVNTSTQTTADPRGEKVTGRSHIRMLLDCVRRFPGRLFRRKKPCRKEKEDEKPNEETTSPSQVVFEAMRSAIMEDPEWTRLMDMDPSGDCINDAFLQIEFNKIAASYSGIKDHQPEDVSLDDLVYANSVGGDIRSKKTGLLSGPQRDRKKPRTLIQPSTSAKFLAKRGRTGQVTITPKKRERKASAK